MAQKLEDTIILALRRNKRLGIKPGSQTDIAYYFGFSRPYVHQLINGKAANTEITIKRVKEYATMLVHLIKKIKSKSFIKC